MITNFNRIGLGTVQMGLAYGLANTTGQPTLTEAKAILTQANKLGIDLLDTAEAYGNSEEIIGNLTDRQFNIVSKWTKDPETTLDQSLQRLNVTNLYGWLAHSGQYLLSNFNDWEIMKRQKEKGVVNKIGYSLYNPDELESLLDNNIIPDLIQIPFNILDIRFAKWLHPLKEMGCEIHCRSVYLQGLFFVNPDQLSSFFDPIKDWLREIHSINSDNLALLAALILKVLSFKEIGKIIIGVDNIQQLKEIATALVQDNQIDFPEIPEVPECIINPSLWPGKR